MFAFIEVHSGVLEAKITYSDALPMSSF